MSWSISTAATQIAGKYQDFMAGTATWNNFSCLTLIINALANIFMFLRMTALLL